MIINPCSSSEILQATLAYKPTHITYPLWLGEFYPLWLGGFRIQPTFALVRVVRGDLSWDINCQISPAHCMLGLLACSEAYEFGQLGTGLSWFR